ncbi:NEP1-interacting protein 1 isoform X2 [Oryza sativa Japonica Group]|uniref:NEP1-interacting protein 1 isoform X2 n=1 Tax=Oryza sativa subsp. japonica TaxID=39947 RepID=UPI00339D0817
MLSLATRLRRVAGKLARCLATCVFATAGMMLGAIAGVIAGFVSEDGLLQGTLIGAISGAFIAMEVVDSLAKIWCYEEYSIATRAHLMLLVFWNLVIDRLTVRTSVFPTLTTVLDSQLNAVPSRHRRAEVSGDLTGRSYPVVMGMRLAAVDQLPVIKLTAAQTDATGACPICLHVRRRRFQGRRDCQEIAGVLPHLPFGVHRQLVAVACPMPNVPSSCQLNAGVHSTYVDLQK